MTLEDAYARVAQAAKAHGKAWGSPVGSAEEIVRRREQGAQLLARGGEFLALMRMLEQYAGEFNKAL